MRTALDDGEIARLGETGWFLRDGFLGTEIARAAGTAFATLTFRPAGMSRGARYRLDRAQRGDEIAWLERESAPPAFTPLFDAFEALRLSANQRAYLGLVRADVQAARYPGGGARYVRHLDAFPGASNRRLTAIYYLNDGWRPEHGGILRLHVGGPGESVDVEPLLDRLVVLLSERIEHEVLPARAERRAVTAWFYGP